MLWKKVQISHHITAWLITDGIFRFLFSLLPPEQTPRINCWHCITESKGCKPWCHDIWTTGYVVHTLLFPLVSFDLSRKRAFASSKVKLPACSNKKMHLVLIKSTKGVLFIFSLFQNKTLFCCVKAPWQFFFKKNALTLQFTAIILQLLSSRSNRQL